MVGYRPRGRAPRMSALRTTAESRAAWSENQLRLDRLYAAELAAELEPRQGGNGHAAERAAQAATPQGGNGRAEERAAQAATPHGGNDHAAELVPQAVTPHGGNDNAAAAAAPAAAFHASVGLPPQLHRYLPGSQAVDAAGASSGAAPPSPLPPSTDQDKAPGGAAAALGVADADCIDNRGQPAIHGPPRTIAGVGGPGRLSNSVEVGGWAATAGRRRHHQGAQAGRLWPQPVRAVRQPAV